MQQLWKPFVLAGACLAGAVLGQPAHAISGDWTIYSHPCIAEQGNPLHRDSDGTLWVGCGAGASGFGLWRSDDQGQSWEIPDTDDGDIIRFFRVFDISRGHDGWLYVSGIDSRTGITQRVIGLNTSQGEPLETRIVLFTVPLVGRNFTVGNYRELPDGRALADSEQGLDKLYRPSATTGASAADWTQPQPSIEAFTQIVTHNDGFYASGSRIAIRPRVFLPPTDPGAQPWQFVEVILDNSFDGEMWGIAVNDSRVVAVGIDQDRNVGKIFVSSGDPYNASNYTQTNLTDIIGTGGNATWARGVCMRDDLIVVVGERQPLGSNSGQVMASNDGGTSFHDIKPTGSVSTVSNCTIAPNGMVTVTGSSGFIAHFDGLMPPDRIFNDRFGVLSD